MMLAVYLIALWVVGADSLVIQEQVPRWQVYRNGMQTDPPRERSFFTFRLLPVKHAHRLLHWVRPVAQIWAIGGRGALQGAQRPG
jgi:hypothetical protein